MDASNEYIIKYHHGGTFVMEREIKYVDGSIIEFSVDPDKICYWDLLEDMKEIGYNVKNSINLFFIEEGGTLKLISDDKDIISLADYLRKYRTTDVYAEISRVGHGIIIPEALLTNLKTDVGLNLRIDDKGDIDSGSDGGSGSDSSVDDEARLLDVVNYSSEDDEEREEARSKVSKYIQLKKTV